MNENDLRACAALMKIMTGATPEECWRFADEFMEASKAEPEEEGIVAIKTTKRRRVKSVV